MKPRPARASAPLVIETIADAAPWEDIDGLPQLAEKAVGAALVACGMTASGELAILLTSDARMRDLNQRFRRKDRPTNVLSFPPQGDRRFGDIALAFETIRDEARTEGKSLEDHLTHLIVHGTLHLAGYDHEEEAAAMHMETLEIAALDSLGIANPYLDRLQETNTTS